MNDSAATQIVESPPRAAETYIHQTPPWLAASFRIALFVTSVATIALSVENWATMPNFAKLLALVIATSLPAFSVWPRPWKSLIKFIADSKGIYFPSNSQLVLSLSSPLTSKWLFVPWRKIENVRLSTETGGEGGPSVAFDARVSTDERETFFKHVGVPRDRPIPSSEVVYASYDDSPPHPKKTLKILVDLRSRSET